SGSSTSNSISTTASATGGGTVSVTANNSCGSSAAQTLVVNISSAPAMPGTITGLDTVCNGSLHTYSVTAVSGATSYTWTLPGSWAGTSASNTISATSGATGGNITIIAYNNCGSSAPQTKSVYVVPGLTSPGPISGPDSLCNGSLVLF